MIPRTGTSPSLALQAQLEPDRRHVVGVLEIEVALHEDPGVAPEGFGGGVVEPEGPELRLLPHLLDGALEAQARRLMGAFAAGVVGVQQLQRPVDEGSLQSVRRR